MLNPFKEVNWSPSEKELKKFSISMLLGFSIIGILWYLITVTSGSSSQLPYYLFGIGVFCFISYFIHKSLGTICYRLIYFLSCCIGIVVSNFILMGFYYLIFTPIALVVRLSTGRDPLRLKKPKGDSNWNKYNKTVSLKRYYKQY